MFQYSTVSTNRRSAALCALALLAALLVTTRIYAADNAVDRAAVAVDAATLDKYVGNYRVSTVSVLTISRDGAQLNAQISGQPKLPIYAETPTRFFWKVVDAQVTFAGTESGQAATATIHQFGHDLVAARVDDGAVGEIAQRLANRVSQQQPQPGGEAALRKTIAAFAAGAPDYEDMTPTLQDVTRRQLPAIQELDKDRGALQSLEFKGVTDMGADKYVAIFQSGKQTQYVIQLGDDGKIALLAMIPRF